MTALVLCGGGSKGVVEVGPYCALVEGKLLDAIMASVAMPGLFPLQARLIALEPPIGLEIDLLDFSHTDELIKQGYASAMAALREWAGPRTRGGQYAQSLADREEGTCGTR
jgi:predicted acylesterase/phospholipase RssA